MKQRIFSHFQDYLIQYISHQYQELLYCNSSQYILSTYNSQHNNNNNIVLAMTMPYSGIVIANTTLLYKYTCNYNSGNCQLPDMPYINCRLKYNCYSVNCQLPDMPYRNYRLKNNM